MDDDALQAVTGESGCLSFLPLSKFGSKQTQI